MRLRGRGGEFWGRGLGLRGIGGLRFGWVGWFGLGRFEYCDLKRCLES